MHEERNNEIKSEKRPSLILSVRFLITFLLFLAVGIQYTHKTDISVGIICMVNHTAIDKNSSNNGDLSANNTDGVKCLFQNTSSNSDPDGPFIWDKGIQEFILASYFYGYLFSQIPGGWFAFKYGSKIVFLISMLIGSIGTILVPICANTNYYVLIACRFATGFVQGVMWPSMMNIWSQWIPNLERGRMLAFASSGSQAGTIVGFSLGGYLCVHGFDGGWPSIFYIFGGAGIIWCILWFSIMSDSPSTHKFISESEKDYIKKGIHDEHTDKEFLDLCKSVFTSRGCLILFSLHFASTWSLSLFLTNVPLYMKEALKFDIQSNGILSSIPYVLLVIVIIGGGITSDKLIYSRKLSKNNVRKLFNCLGMFLPAASMFGLSFVKCDKPYLGVAVLTFGIATNGFLGGGGFIASYSDITGSYAGFTFGISNTIAQLTGVIVPYTVAAMTKNQTQQEWAYVFILAGCIMSIGGIICLFFKSSETESWALKETSFQRINENE